MVKTNRPLQNRIQQYQQVVATGMPDDNLDASLRVELIYRGMIMDLKSAFTLDSIDLLTSLSFSNPIELVRKDALYAIGEMAIQGFEPAISTLFSLFIIYDQELAAQIIIEKNIKALTPEEYSAFLVLSLDKVTFFEIDPSLDFLNRYYDQAEPEVKKKLITSAKKCGLPVWAMIHSALQDQEKANFTEIIDQFPAFTLDEEELFFRRIEQGLIETNSQVYIEFLTDLFFRYDHPLAAASILRTPLRPESQDRHALLLYLSNTWDEYELVDFDQRLITIAYQNADANLRKRILQHSRQSGYTDWVQQVTQQSTKRSYWASELTDADWKVTLDVLSRQERWHDLWRLSLQCPPVWSFAFINQLIQNDWRPDRTEENQDFERLAGLCKQIRTANVSISPFEHIQTSTERANCLSFHAPSKLIALGGNSGKIALYQWDQGNIHHATSISLGMIPGTRAIQFDQSAKYLAAAGGDHLIRVVELETRKIIKTFEGHENLIRGMAISHDGRTLYSCSFDGKLNAWQFPSASQPQLINQSPKEYLTLSLSGSNQYLLVAGADSVIRVFQTPSGSLVREIVGHEAGINHLAASQSSEIAVSSDLDNRVLIWNYLSGKQLNHISLDTDSSVITSILLIHGDQLLVIGTADGKISIFSTSNGNLVIPAWHAHQGRIIGMDFDPDSAKLLSLSSNGEIKTWSLNSLLIIRSPLSTKKLTELSELEMLLNQNNIMSSDKSWIRLVTELIKINHRYDIQLGEPTPISIGEFDIQIEEG